MIPSAYQAAIYNWVDNGSGNGVADAVPGSGKTVTLEGVAQRAEGKLLILAFNVHIKDALLKKQQQGRISKSAMIKTVSSFGWMVVQQHLTGKINTNQWKYRNIAKLYIESLQLPKELNAGVKVNLNKLVSLTMLTLTDPKDRAAMEALADKHSIVMNGDSDFFLTAVPAILKEGQRIARVRKEISYEDMLYLPYVWKVKVPNDFSFILVDEAQDLSPAALELIMCAMGPDTRLLGVGDENQAIYSFAGADCDSIEKLVARTNALRLPLSVCYRCPKSHVAIAKRMVPQIEAAPAAIDGFVGFVDYDDLPTKVQSGDLLLCRTTAPLLKLCIQLIGKQIPAKVRGKNIGEDLVALVEDITKVPGYSWTRFGISLEDYLEAKIEKLGERRNPEGAIEDIKDRVEGVRACYEGFQGLRNAWELGEAIKGLFSDKDEVVMLSTVHRAKGLEADRVFILRADKLPLVRKNQKPHEIKQEFNIKFISITRSRIAMFFVQEEKTAEVDWEEWGLDLGTIAA